MAALIGALRVSLSADSAAFVKGMTRAERQAKQSGTVIQRSLNGIKAGIAGLAAGITLGALTAVAKRALDYASSLGEVSQQLGVTTRDLQVFRYAATQTGVSQEQMDKGLQRLTKSIGDAAAGSKPLKAAFKEIGIEVDDLRRNDTGAIFRMMADGLSKVESSADRAAIETAIFGRAGQNLDTLLKGGSAAIHELGDAAERLGIVLSDEQIQKADETADKLAAVKTILEARIAGTVADNADSVLTLANALMEVAGAAARAGGALVQYGEQARWALERRLAESPLTSWTPRGREAQANVARKAAKTGLGMANAMGFGLIGGPGRPRGVAGAGGVGDFLDTSGGGGKKGKSAEALAREAERARQEALRRAYEVETDQLRAQSEVLRAQESLAHDYSERTTLAIQILDLERRQEQLANKLAVDMGDRDEAEAAALELKYAERDRLQRREIIEEEQQRRLEDVARLEDERAEIQRDLLAGEAALAETAAERREVEMRILEHAYREERARLERIMRDSRDDAERERARQRLGSLGAREAQDREGVRRGTRGPMEDFLASLPTSAAKADEALEAVAANGLQALTDGITDAITGAKSLGEAFSNASKQIIADLIKIGIQRMIIAPLANALFGPAPASGGSGGRALGGPVLPGRSYVVGEHGQERFVPWTKGVIVPDNDNPRIQIIPSPYFDVVVDGRAQRVAAPMAGQAALAGSSGAQTAIARRSMRQIP